MTKEEILEHFKDINSAYNESTRYDDLSRMLDELLQQQVDDLNKIAEIMHEESDFAYADFDMYKWDTLGADADELPEDDYRYGLVRAVEIINTYLSGGMEALI